MQIIERHAVRALILTPCEHVLLIRMTPPDGAAPFWIAPGGGIDEGETAEAALRRELDEEVGLTDFTFGPLVWRRHHTYDWLGRRLCQREVFHIVEAPRFEPVMRDAVEARVVGGFHWWPHDQIPHAAQPITPRSLADIIARYRADGPPDPGSLVEEVLVD